MGQPSVSLPLDPRTFDRALSCVHCGLCLPACPTYTQTFHEADSPRGRIQLMRGLAEGAIQPTASVRHHLDLCLDCRACETACPSAVVYHELIEETRGRLYGDVGRIGPDRSSASPATSPAATTPSASNSATSHIGASATPTSPASPSPSPAALEPAPQPIRFKLTFQERLLRWMFFHIMVHPTRLKLLLLPARLMQKIGLYALLRKIGLFKLLPVRFRKMEQMLPAEGSLWPRRLPEKVAPKTKNEKLKAAAEVQKLEVRSEKRQGSSSVVSGPLSVASSNQQPTTDNGQLTTDNGPRTTDNQPLTMDNGHPPTSQLIFFPGCIGSVMFERVNRQAVEVLSSAGCEIRVPRAMGCCGAIHHHNGAWEPAREMARRNIDALFPAPPASAPPSNTAPSTTGRSTTATPPASPADSPIQFITTTIAGCGAMLKDYGHLLRDDPLYAARAAEFSARIRDISEVLVHVGLPEMTHPVDEVVTYHDACHLAHAQKVTAAPRALLSAIPGLQLLPLSECDMCCGAAGTYNLTQPEMATALAVRKLSHIARTGAAICATGNVGCAMHLQSQADAVNGRKVKIVHPVELVHRAVFGEG